MTEDLKAFERRLTEIVSNYKRRTKKFRILLTIAALITSITTLNWFNDETKNVTYVDFFTFNYIGLLILFSMGLHKRAVATSIILSRIRQVLENFNMSCDQNGRLILKRTSTNNLNNSYNTNTGAVNNQP